MLVQILICLVSRVASYSAHNEFPRYSRSLDNSTFDYIIIGGGLTGLVVANRLTEDPLKNVLVAENGYIDRDYAAEVPYATLGLNTDDMWNITSAPESRLNNASFFVTVGSVVGGGSVVNGMACTRGSKADYDAWRQLGNPGWGWDGLFPYFLKSTNFTPPLPEIIEDYGVTWDPSVWGDSGPVQVGHPSFFFPDTTPVRNAWIDQGIPNLVDGAAGTLGLSWLPTDVDSRSGTRSSARAAYYDPSAARPNLRLLTGHKVIEILFVPESLEASGVLIRSRADNSTLMVSATKEVILAAGDVFTPQLLQRSGLGPKGILEAANVIVKKDMPAVGANFQDHPTISMAYNISNSTFPTLSALAQNATFNASAWAGYQQNHTGPYTSGRVGNNGDSVIFLPLSSVLDTYQDVVENITSQYALDFLPATYSQNSPLLKGFEAQKKILNDVIIKNQPSCCEFIPSIVGGAAISLQKPLSRGTITLDPSDPDAPPVIRYNTIMNPVDAAIIVAMVRFEREYWASPELARYSPIENLPGTQYQTDEEILDGLVSTGILAPSLAHPSGTCAMMPEDLGGCVGPDLLVYGTEKLSVIDASILPLIPGTHLQMTMYGVGEKAADIIKSRA
ncbi:GMC oxidoreductase [Seiridium cupressi]